MPQDQKHLQRTVTDADLPGVLDTAQGLRRIFEADPAGAVQPQVELKLTESLHRGLLQDPAQEGELRRVLTRYYQTEAGIAEPRRLSNQARAELALAFRNADTAGRVGLLEALEAQHGPDLPAVADEVFEALPRAERSGARRVAARFAEDRDLGVEPLLGAQLAGFTEDLKAPSEQVAAEEARAVQPTDEDEKPENVHGVVSDQRSSAAAERPPRADAAALLSNGLGITSDWAGPAFTEEDSAFLADLVDDVLTAELKDLPDLLEHVEEVFGDDPMTVQRLADLARLRFADPEGTQGSFGHGRRQEAERELRLRRDRLLAGQDYHMQRHADRAAFARAEAVSGFRLQLQDDGSVAIGESGEVPLVTVGWSVASAMARGPDALRERLALLERLTDSTEPLDEQIEQINRALGISDQVDIETPRTDEEDARAAILAANAAIREGQDPVAIRAGLIGILFPEIHRDPMAWSELLLDFLPVIGQVRAVIDTVESLDASAEALERGDLEEAKRQGLLGALAAAGVVPVAGPLYKTIGTLTRRAFRSAPVTAAIRATPILNKVDALRRLRKGLNESKAKVRGAGAREIFSDAWPLLTPDEKSLVRGLLPHLKGRPVLGEFEEVMKILGVDLVQTQNERSLMLLHRKRIYDQVARDGIPEETLVLGRLFLIPDTKIRRGAAVEVKEVHAFFPKRELMRDDFLIRGLASGRQFKSLGNVRIQQYLIFRAGLDELPEKHILEAAERFFDNHVNGTVSRRLTPGKAKILKEAFVDWVREERRKGAGEIATFGEALVALALSANAGVVGHAAEAGFDDSELEADPRNLTEQSRPISDFTLP